jgi:hypothetical protein
MSKPLIDWEALGKAMESIQLASKELNRAYDRLFTQRIVATYEFSGDAGGSSGVCIRPRNDLARGGEPSLREAAD